MANFEPISRGISYSLDNDVSPGLVSPVYRSFAKRMGPKT